MQKKLPLYAWSMWLIAAIFYSLDYFQHTAPSVLIKPIADSLHISFISVGNIMSIYFPIYAISQLPAGYLLDKYGCKLVLSLACLVVSIGLLCMMVPNLPMLIFGRVLIAIGSAFAFLGALKTASHWLPKSAFPIAVGLTNTIGVMGGMMGQSFLNLLIIKYTWINATLYIGLFGIFISLMIFLFLKSAPDHSASSEQTFYGQIFKNKQIWLLAIYAGIMVGTVVNAFSELYDVVFLEKVFSIHSQTAALISTMIFVGIAVGGPLHGIIAKCFKHTRSWMLLACLLTIMTFSGIIVVALLKLNANLMFLLYFATGFFVSSMLLTFSQVRCLFPTHIHATAFAFINMIIGLCGFTFQLLLGEILAYIDNFAVGFILLLLPLSVSFWLCYKTKKL